MDTSRGMSPLLLSFGSLIFTTTSYYLLKNYLVEWGCRRFLKGRVRLVNSKESEAPSQQNGHTHANGVVPTKESVAEGGGDGLTRVTKGDMAEVAQLMVSQMITGATAIVTGIAMWQTSDDCVKSKSPLLVTFVHIPAWYLFYDLFAMFDAFTLRKNLRHLSWGRQLRLYVTKKSGLVSHHIILFLFGYLLVADYSVRSGKGDFIIALFMSMEFTNPFLSMAIVLKTLGLTKSRVYMVNGIILILLFFVMRILNYPIAVLVYAAQYHNWSIWSALKSLYLLCHTLSAIQFAFQAFWFYQIFRLGAKAILSKKEA